MIDAKRITILDIDGTVSAHWGRQKLLPPRPWITDMPRADFEEYHARAVSDPVINSAIPLAQDNDAYVIFNTTRPESYRASTIIWIKHHMQVDVTAGQLLMRADDDDTVSHVQKSGALRCRFEAMIADGLSTDMPVAVYDDDFTCLRSQYDVLFTDCRMNNIETFRAIRTHAGVGFMRIKFQESFE